MKRSILFAFVLAVGALFAHDEPKGKPISMTGTVVDTGCYMAHGAKGADHVRHRNAH